MLNKIGQVVGQSNKNNIGLHTRIMKPRKYTAMSQNRVKYKYAQDLAKATPYNENETYHCVVNGTFIFGDFIEAYIIQNQLLVKELTISTLGYSQNNVDSLVNLVNGDYLRKLTIIASAEFYGFERAQTRLIPYTYEKLNTGNLDFQLSFADTHMKVVNIATDCGKFITMHGSANLRSSGNVEQFVIEHSRELYDFYQSFMADIAEKTKTIKKPIRKSAMWEIVDGEK